MSQDLKERFPELFFDTQVIEKQVPKATPPTIAQVMAKVLQVNGIQNNALATDLAGAAEAFFKGS